ncbi:pitrilysin family protein [Alloacidobacterium sp.]|uniref:M16 family metallopeptidase n=1 Tax=Alloacidobacterium sp. TaxID=2951999 RepID=UPI002D27C426|nr:pitrilysin family protein [Alloacidobacterium sp.]HYK35969.1 pitrilysin family protein [Alloacidobacterium sp.]
MALLTFTASAETPSKLKVPEIKYETYTMPNGLQVMLTEDHRLPIVGVDLWYHVGPVKERAGRTGFAHLFEHMMFEGSKHVGEKAHFKYLEAAGASDINGTTDFDRTNYFETLPSNQLELALWLESDRMGFLLDTLDRTKLTNQRDVVRNERRQSVENQPYGLVDEALVHELFPKDHPYHADVIGSHADVEAARLEDVRQFFKQYYAPNNGTIAIAGDIDKAKTKALLEKYFGPIPKGPDVPKVDVSTPDITSEKRVTVTDTVQLPKVEFGWLTPPAFAPGDAEADAAAYVLGGGKSSHLYRKLVYEQQIAQSTTCYNQSEALRSWTTCELMARPGVTAEQLEKAANGVIDEFLQSGPTQEEIDRARNTTESRKIRGLQRVGGFGGVADTLNYYNQYTGDPGYLPKDIARYNALTVAGVQKFAQASLTQSQRVTVYGIPGKKVVDDVPRSPADTDANVRIQPEYSAKFDQSQAWRKTPPQAGPQPKLSLPEPVTFTLANGLKVYLVESHSLPVVSASLVALGGSEGDSPKEPGVAGFTAAMLTEGTAKRTAPQIADDTDQIGASLTKGAGNDNAFVRISALSNVSDQALDLLSDVSLHPAFSDAEIERIRRQRLTSLVQMKDQPVQVAFQVAARAIYGADNPYGYLSIGTENAIKATTREDLVNFWRERYTPANSALVFAGDLTEKQARDLAEKYFGSWSSKGTASQPPAAPAPPTRRVILVNMPGAPQTAIFAAGIGVPRSNLDFAPLNVDNTMLGGLFSSRINMNLREQHGYTYGAFSRFQFWRGSGPFFAGASVRADVTGPAVQQLFYELDRIRTNPLTPEELKMSKDYLMRSLPGDFETVEETTGRMSEIFTYQLPLDYYRAYPAKIDAVTSNEAASAALKYIHPENMVLVAVGDKAKIQPEIEKLNLGPVEEWNTDIEPVKK